MSAIALLEVVLLSEEDEIRCNSLLFYYHDLYSLFFDNFQFIEPHKLLQHHMDLRHESFKILEKSALRNWGFGSGEIAVINPPRNPSFSSAKSLYAESKSRSEIRNHNPNPQPSRAGNREPDNCTNTYRDGRGGRWQSTTADWTIRLRPG